MRYIVYLAAVVMLLGLTGPTPAFAAHHGSPWQYDTYVPMTFAGYGIEPRRVARRVETVDLAPKLSAVFELKPPSGAAGKTLAEVLAVTRP